MTVGAWSHWLMVLMGLTSSEAIEIMKMGLRKRRNAGMHMMHIVCMCRASKHNSQSWSVVNSRKK